MRPWPARREPGGQARGPVRRHPARRGARTRHARGPRGPPTAVDGRLPERGRQARAGPNHPEGPRDPRGRRARHVTLGRRAAGRGRARVPNPEGHGDPAAGVDRRTGPRQARRRTTRPTRSRSSRAGRVRPGTAPRVAPTGRSIRRSTRIPENMGPNTSGAPAGRRRGAGSSTRIRTRTRLLSRPTTLRTPASRDRPPRESAPPRRGRGRDPGGGPIRPLTGRRRAERRPVGRSGHPPRRPAIRLGVVADRAIPVVGRGRATLGQALEPVAASGMKPRRPQRATHAPRPEPPGQATQAPRAVPGHRRRLRRGGRSTTGP